MNPGAVSIVLPIHNQADHLAALVGEYEAALANLPREHELVLVPNACRDQSAAISHELAKQYPGRIQVVESAAGGWGRAVKLGLGAAQGDLLCYTNSARTSPQDLFLFLVYAAAYPRVVIKANRKSRDSFQRRLGSVLYNMECRLLFDLPNWDVNGTPKVFPRTFDKLLALTRDDDLIDVEFNFVCRKEGYPMLEVPLLMTRRHGGKSTTGFNSAIKLYWGAYELWREQRRSGRGS
jgi:glycosyltransferase involved in cell wall biosynthesis